MKKTYVKILKTGEQDRRREQDRRTEERRHISMSERRERQLAALHELWRAMSQCDPAHLLSLVVERVTGAMDAHTGSLLLRERGGDTLRVAASVGLPSDVADSVTLLLGERIAGRVAASGQAILVPRDPRAHPLLANGEVRPRPEIDSALCAPLTAPDGTTIGVLCLSRHAPAQSFTEADLRMANLFAAQSGAYIAHRHLVEEGLRTAGLAALGQMAATVAHELRNPLGSIKGAAQFLEAQAKVGKATPEAIADLLGIIVEEVNGLGALTTNLLEFARPAPLMCADIDLAEVVENEVAFLREELTRIGVLDLQVNVMRPARVWGDAAQLSRVLRNLLLNAAQAVASVANSRAEGRVQLALTPQDNGWVLTLRDNGPGIPESVRHRLFEPFFTTKARGTGLGLAQVRQTIEAHGGEVRAENHDEGGAVFTLWLPDEQKETTHGNNFSGR